MKTFQIHSLKTIILLQWPCHFITTVKERYALGWTTVKERYALGWDQ